MIGIGVVEGQVMNMEEKEIIAGNQKMDVLIT